MIKSLPLLFLIFWCTALIAQDTALDSLQQALQTTSNDIEKAELLNTIADRYKTQDPEKTRSFAEEALALSQKIKYRKEEGTAYINLGNYNLITGRYPEALEAFRSAKTLFESDPEPGTRKLLARVYGSIGIVFSEQSSYDKALEYHLKAVQLYESEGDRPTLARVYNNVGIVYKAQNDLFKALNYFIKAQTLQDSLQDPTRGITLTNIGNIYLRQQDYEKANEYYRQAEEIFEQHTNHRGLGELYNNLGLYYQATGAPGKAVESWDKALESFARIQDKFGISDTYYYLGGMHLENRDYAAALEATQEAGRLARELGILEMQALSETQLQAIYEATGDYRQALEHSKNHAVLKDSLVSYENIRRAVQSEMDFAFEKKEALLHEKQQRQEVVLIEQTKRHRMQLIFGGLFALLCFGLGFLFYNRNQLKKTLTLQKNLAEYEQKALHLQMNPHFVFNCLGSISSFIVQNGNDSALKYLAKFSKLMRLTLEYSKESLIPVDKEIEGLQNYLELEQLRFNKAFEFSITKDSNIEDDMALPPLLIQPFVENAIIHGIIPKKERGCITVAFTVQDNHLHCTVTDDGIGIETSRGLKEQSVSVHKSMALDIIKKRLEMLDDSTSKSSRLTIEELKDVTGKATGTRVVLVLPVRYY